jgi:hypothetical protein
MRLPRPHPERVTSRGFLFGLLTKIRQPHAQYFNYRQHAMLPINLPTCTFADRRYCAIPHQNNLQYRRRLSLFSMPVLFTQLPASAIDNSSQHPSVGALRGAIIMSLLGEESPNQRHSVFISSSQLKHQAVAAGSSGFTFPSTTTLKAETDVLS